MSIRLSRRLDATAKGLSFKEARALVGRYRDRPMAVVAAKWRPKPGMVYTQVRAISARVNQNYDAWPSTELKKSYRSFIGKPIFVNHGNDDPERARGVVVASRYVESGQDKYIEVIQETDGVRYPKLGHEIKTGGLDSVSMGVEAGFTICSVCENRAEVPEDMCSHVKFHKGEHLRHEKTGEKTLVYEKCYKLGFFELSYVFDPADETALVSRVISASTKQAESAMPGHSWYHPSEHETHTYWSPKSEAYQDHPSPNTVVRLRNPEDTNIYDNASPEEQQYIDPLGFMEPYTPSKQEYHVRERDRPENRLSYVDCFDRKEGRVVRHWYRLAEDARASGGYGVVPMTPGTADSAITNTPDRGTSLPDFTPPGPNAGAPTAPANQLPDPRGFGFGPGSSQGIHAGAHQAGWYVYGYGEVEAPEDIDTLRDESEDDTDDFHHWVDSPPELRAPDMDQAKRLDRAQEEDGLDNDRRAEDAEEFGAPGEEQPQFADEEQQDPNNPPMPINVPAPRKGRRNRSRGASMSRSYRYAADEDEDFGDDTGSQDDSGGGDDIDALVNEAEQDLEDYENESGGGDDSDDDSDDDSGYEDGEDDSDEGGDFGDEGDDDSEDDASEDGGEEEASGDQPPWLQKGSSRPVRSAASPRNRREAQGGQDMTGSTLASRARVAARGRQHLADDNGYTDGGPYGVDDSQGLQEDVFISQVPSAEAVDMPADDASNVSNSPNNLVAWKQPQFDPNHYQRMADVVAALPPEQRRAVAEKMVRTFKADNGRFNELTFYKAAKVRLVRQGNRLFFAEDLEDPDKVDPGLSGTDVQDLKGDDFESVALDDVETQPKDASIHAFAAFDQWLAQATGKTARQHANANYIRRAAASYVKNTGRSLEGLFPTLEYVLREAKKLEKGADMRRRAEDVSLETAAPDGRVDVEAPVKNVTDEKAQASQFDLGDFANNASDNLADPVLDVVDGNAGTWAPDKAKESSLKLASGVEAVRCAEAYIAAMPHTYSNDDRWQLTARFETLRQAVVRERIRLLEAVVEDRKQAKTARKVSAAPSRGTKGIPPGFGSGQRTATTQKIAASDPDTDSMMFFG